MRRGGAEVFRHLFREELQQTIRHERRGRAEAAGAGRAHHRADVADFLGPRGKLRRAGFAGEALGQALRADAAGETLAATLVREEFHRVVRGANHVAAVIEHDDAARAEEGALAADAWLVERAVKRVAGEEATAEAGHRHGLDGASCGRAAGPIVEQRLERKADGDFVVAGGWN